MPKSLENIERSLLEMYINNPDLAREELTAAGYDVNALVSDGLSIIKQHKFKAQAQANKNHLKGLLNKAKELLKQKLADHRENALAILNSYQVKVQFRNIENLNDSELNSILKDVDLIKLIEDLEKENRGLTSST